MRRLLVVGLSCLVATASATSFVACGDDSDSNDTADISCELGTAVLTERVLNELEVAVHTRGIGALLGSTVAGHYIASDCSDFLENLVPGGTSGASGQQ
jgi:hypothetical protein